MSVIIRTPAPVETLSLLCGKGRLFAVLDACDAPAVPLLCDSLGESRAVSLYRGSAEEAFFDIAPYLVSVDTDELLQWIVAYSALPAWGILLMGDIPFSELRTHLRRFLKVTDPSGRRLYFRFYDPRVLDMFLMTADADQAELFLGRLGAVGALSAGTDLMTFRLASRESVERYAAR